MLGTLSEGVGHGVHLGSRALHKHLQRLHTGPRRGAPRGVIPYSVLLLSLSRPHGVDRVGWGGGYEKYSLLLERYKLVKTG